MLDHNSALIPINRSAVVGVYACEDLLGESFGIFHGGALGECHKVFRVECHSFVFKLLFLMS